MFRDAVRIGQIAGAGAAEPQQHAVLEEALMLFDQAAMIRLCTASLARLAGGPLGAWRSGGARRCPNGTCSPCGAPPATCTKRRRRRARGGGSGALHVASLVLVEKGR